MYGNKKQQQQQHLFYVFFTVLRNLDSNVSRGQLEEFITVVTVKVVRLHFTGGKLESILEEQVLAMLSLMFE